MTAKLIFSDIDGTLLNDQLQVTFKTRKAIQQQIIQGNIFIPASARLPKGIMTAVGQILRVFPYIAYNGALALDETGKVVISRFFDARTAAEICRYVDQQHSSAVWNVYSGYVWYCNLEKDKLVEREEKIVNVKATPVAIEQIEQLQGVHKMLIMGDPADIDYLQQELQKQFKNVDFVKSSPTLLEIVLKGVSKASAVKIMAQEYGVDLKDCIAFGDNYNDEAMLDQVGQPFLMGNAPSDLKSKFALDQLTADNNHDGIARALEK